MIPKQMILKTTICVTNNVDYKRDFVSAEAMTGGPIELYILVPGEERGFRVELDRRQLVEFMARTTTLSTFLHAYGPEIQSPIVPADP